MFKQLVAQIIFCCMSRGCRSDKRLLLQCLARAVVLYDTFSGRSLAAQMTVNSISASLGPGAVMAMARKRRCWVMELFCEPCRLVCVRILARALMSICQVLHEHCENAALLDRGTAPEIVECDLYSRL